jgi:hypothetical protein
MSGIYRVLIHSRLHEALLRRDARPLLAPLAKALAHLQCGYWGGGTRVKKLRGHAKAVFEARLNEADRVLFTVATTATREPPHTPTPHLLVWDIVNHDAVDRRRFNLEPEASFLDFPAVAELTIEEPPLRPEAPLADGPADPLTALQTAAEDPAGREELLEAVRWYMVDPDWVLDGSAWQALYDAGAQDLELKLTREQYEVLYRSGPVLLSGAAGSGKTTLTVHWLARHAVEHPAARMLYVTYSDLLLDQVRSWFRALLRARRQTIAAEPRFVTFPDLYRELADTIAPPLRYPRFAEWYGRMTARCDAALAWEEIRGILKGACLDLERPALEREEYEALGRKRAPLFVAERPRLYAIGRRYAEWLRLEGLADDVDLARGAWRARRVGRGERFDVVVCDEVQDLTELEMNLLLELVADPLCGSLLITGDPQQIVNPSGFRWAELRTLFLRRWKALGRPAPDVVRLTRNYRSVRGIVAVANALLAIQRERTGRSDDDTSEEGVTQGPAPFLVQGEAEKALAAARDFGPRCAVLTATPRQAEALRTALGSTRVFDVASAKGLEFDAVVLWDFMAPDEALWRELLTGTADGRENPVWRRLVHHAYVAVTRARQWLAVYETGAAASLWRSGALRACLEPDTPAALRRILSTAATPDAWTREAEYYLRRRRFQQAAECYRRAGNAAEAALAEARGHAEAGRWPEAAAAYERLGRPAEAAEALAQAREYERAAGMLREAGQPEQADAMLRRHWEQRGEWRQLAEFDEQRGRLGDAIAAYARAGRLQDAARLRLHMAREAGDWRQVGSLEEAAGNWDAAAGAYEQAGEPRSAARCRALGAERQGDAAAACREWRAAGDEERALRFSTAPEDLMRRAQEQEREGNPRQAVALWQQVQAARPDPALARRIEALQAEARREFLGAAEIFRELSDWRGVQRTIERVDAGSRWRGDHRQMAMRFRAQGLRAEAAIRLTAEELGPEAGLKALRQYRLWPHTSGVLRAELAEKAGQWAVAAKAHASLRDWPNAQRCAERAGGALAPEIRARHAEAENRHAEAEAAWLEAGQPRRAAAARARRAEAAGDWPQALAAWAQAGRWSRVRALERKRGADGRAPAGMGRREAMVTHILGHPLCARKEIQQALGLTPGEAGSQWPAIERDPRVRCFWSEGRKLYIRADHPDIAAQRLPERPAQPSARMDLFPPRPSPG